MKRRPGIELWLLALVCFGPVLAAYLLYFYGDTSGLPLVPNEQRVLVNPAVPLPDAAVLGIADPRATAEEHFGWGPRWTLLYVRTSDCGETCRTELVRLAQVHAALGRDQSRVRRVYLGPRAAERASADPSLTAATLSETSAAAVGSAAAVPGGSAASAVEGSAASARETSASAREASASVPDGAAASVSAESAAILLDLLEAAGTPANATGRVYVVDPHGNLVLGYPPDPDQEALLDDLERLLDVSQIG